MSRSRLVVPLRPSMEESMEEREGHMGRMQVSVATAEDDVVCTAQGQNRKHGGQGSEHGGAMTPGLKASVLDLSQQLRAKDTGFEVGGGVLGRKVKELPPMSQE